MPNVIIESDTQIVIGVVACAIKIPSVIYNTVVDIVTLAIDSEDVKSVYCNRNTIQLVDFIVRKTHHCNIQIIYIN